MKSIALTQTRNASFLFGLIGLVVMLGLTFSGCATRGWVNTQIAEEREARQQSAQAMAATTATGLQVLAAAVEKVEAKASTNASTIAKVRGQIAVAGEKIAGVEAKVVANAGGVDWLKNWASGVDGRLTGIDKTIATKASMAEVAKVKTTANVATQKTTALTRRVGKMETTHYDHDGRLRPEQIDFPTAQLVDPDAKTPVFKACAELLPGSKKYLDEKIVKLIKDGKVGRQISGFADDQPFVNSKGKPREDSDKLNAACADERARAAFQYLVEVLDPSEHQRIEKTTVTGMGKTTRFGEYKADRSVVVELYSL